MNKLELVEHIAKEADLTKVAAAAALEAALDGVAQVAQEGRRSPPRRLRHFLGSRARRRQGAQPGDRQGDQDRRVEERALQGRRRAQGGAEQEGARQEVSGSQRGRNRPRRDEFEGGPRPPFLSPRFPIGLGLAGASHVVCPGKVDAQRQSRAVSSVGRASRLHREGRRFEPVTAHQPARRVGPRSRGACRFLRRGGLRLSAGRGAGGGRAGADDLSLGQFRLERLRRQLPAGHRRRRRHRGRDAAGLRRFRQAGVAIASGCAASSS